MRSLSASCFGERVVGGGRRSLLLSMGWELCGGVAAPERLESMLLVEARAAAALAESSRNCGFGFGECIGSMSMSASMASGSGRTDFDKALFFSTSNASK